MRKYKIYNSNNLIFDEFVCNCNMSSNFVQLKYKNCNIYKSCCFIDECQNLRMQFFLEIKKESNNLDDFLMTKKETVRVVDFISKEFDIKVEYIRIYFNGDNGFYIVVPNMAMGLYDLGEADIYLKIKHIAEYIKKQIKSDYIVTDNYRIDLMHLEFDSLNINTNLYTNRISRDNLDTFNIENLLNYFSNAQREKFTLGVRDRRDIRNNPEGKLKEVLDSYNSLYTYEELVREKESFFNLSKSKNFNTSENVETLKTKIANDINYNRGNNYLLYMYNSMLSAINKTPKKDISALKNFWLKTLIIDFLIMTNADKNLGVYEQFIHSYLYRRINGIEDYIIEININNYYVENNIRFMCISYYNTKFYGDYRIPESEIDFEDIIEILSNIDFLISLS